MHTEKEGDFRANRTQKDGAFRAKQNSIMGVGALGWNISVLH